MHHSTVEPAILRAASRFRLRPNADLRDLSVVRHTAVLEGQTAQILKYEFGE